MKRKVKGFTLVEMIISMIILCLVISLATSVLFLTSNMYQREVTIGAYQSVGNGVINLLEDKMQYGMNISVMKSKPSDPSKYSEIFYVMNGRLYEDIYDDDGTRIEYERDVFGEDYYLGGILKLKAESNGDNIVTITAEMYDPSDDFQAMYTVSKSVKLVNVGKASSATLKAGKEEFTSDGKLFICVK